MNRSMEELIPLVAELTEKYTGKESSSIPYDKARQLMGAVIYCIDEFETAGIAAGSIVPESTAQVSAREAYNRGYQLLLKKAEQTKAMYHQILADFCSYGNEAYRDTFEKGIPAFFLCYDPRFNPQNHILTLDYPVLETLSDRSGIDIIADYVECIGLEQQFLKALPKSFIRHVLSAYHPEYEILIINIAGIVLRNLLGCMMAGKRVDTTMYTDAEQQQITELVGAYPAKQLSMMMSNRLSELIRHGYHSDQRLEQYLQNAIWDFSFELKHAVEYNHLERVLAIAGVLL